MARPGGPATRDVRPGRSPPPTRGASGRTRSRTARAAPPVRSRRSRPRPTRARRPSRCGRRRSDAQIRSPHQPKAISAAMNSATWRMSPACCIEMAASASVGPSTTTTSAIVMAASTTIRVLPNRNRPSLSGRRGASAAGAVIDSTILHVDPQMGGGTRARPVVPGYTSCLMSWETMRNLVRDEWVILSLLLAWSLAGLTVICERCTRCGTSSRSPTRSRTGSSTRWSAGTSAKASALCEMSQVPLADVFERGLRFPEDAREDDRGGDVATKRDGAVAQDAICGRSAPSARRRRSSACSAPSSAS